jgi:pyruvate/2-oxoglutarate dehydrogenase complex dihydrolipoamide acyltransferase (E2) component
MALGAVHGGKNDYVPGATLEVASFTSAMSHESDWALWLVRVPEGRRAAALLGTAFARRLNTCVIAALLMGCAGPRPADSAETATAPAAARAAPEPASARTPAEPVATLAAPAAPAADEVAKLAADLEVTASEVNALRIDGADFTPTDHRQLLERLDDVPKACALGIAREQFRMETSAKYAKDAAPQFLNCHIVGGITFIDGNLSDLHAAAATSDAERGRIAIARVLHSIQDFHANTNYVELMAVKYPSSAESVPVLALWIAADQKEVVELAKRGLISGEDATLTVSGPSQCKNGHVPRSELSKISREHGAGAQRIEKWNKMPRYDAAMTFALRSSNAFLLWALEQYPAVLDGCSVILLPWWK